MQPEEDTYKKQDPNLSFIKTSIYGSKETPDSKKE
jgi:hypothetical protein